MDLDLFFWILSRVAGISSFIALAISLLTGVALRTAVLDWLGSNRVVKSVHEYTAVLWIPLGVLHLVSLILDHTARIGLLDLLIPFRAPYGTVSIGLGTLSFEIFALVALTGWLKKRLTTTLWQWLHRLSYVGFALLFLHALLGGTDFSDPIISAMTWSVALALALISMARVLWGRLPA